MRELAVSAARNHLADAIDRVRDSGEPIFVTRRGRRVAVIVAADVYETLVDAAENALDRADLEVARTDNDYVPWEQVKADLGLV